MLPRFILYTDEYMIDYRQHINAERILQDGWELFQRKGYLGVTMDEICLSCGISKPTLYYYFKNKENLFVEVLLRRLQGFRMAVEQEGDLVDRLACFAVVVFNSFQKDYSLLMRDLEHIKTPENVRRVSDAFSIELFQPVSALMQLAVESGQLSGDAKFLTHLFLGIIQSYIARGQDYDLDQLSLAKKLVAFFLQGASS